MPFCCVLYSTMNDNDTTNPNTESHPTPKMAGATDSAVASAAPPLPNWRVCARCGHMWRSRARGFRFRCRRCEDAVRAAATEASRAAGGDGQ